MKKAVIYARYSAGPKQTDVSIEGQIRECKEYIKYQGYQFVRTYEDKHISGKTDKRPAFQEMISDAEDKSFDVIVVYSLDRFSRDKFDSVIYKKKLHELKIRVESSQEHIPEGPEGILMESMLEGFAMYYSEELARKIKRGMHDRALKCQYVGSSPPFGYTVNEDKSISVDEKIAPFVRSVYNRYLNGETFADLSRWLNSQGFRTSRGKEFGKNSIRRMLTNEFYIGTYKWGDVKIEKGVPSIIDDEVFEMVQEKIEKRTGHAPKGNFALTGKLFCGICGSAMTGCSGTSKTGKIHYYYKCPGKDRKNINRTAFEAYIAAIVRETFSDDLELDSLADKLFTLQADKSVLEREIGALKHELATVTYQIDKTVALVDKDLYTEAAHKRVLDLEKRQRDLQIIIEDKEAQTGKIISKDLIKKALQAYLKGLIFSDEDLADEKILESFVYKVTLFDNYLIVDFNIQGLEGLKSSDPIEFDQSHDWWTKRNSTRTLTILSTGLCLVAEMK